MEAQNGRGPHQGAPSRGQMQEPKAVSPTAFCGIRVCQVERETGSPASSLKNGDPHCASPIVPPAVCPPLPGTPRPGWAPAPGHSDGGRRYGFSTSASARRGAELLQGPTDLSWARWVWAPGRGTRCGGGVLHHSSAHSLGAINLESALIPDCPHRPHVLCTGTSSPCYLGSMSSQTPLFTASICQHPILQQQPPPGEPVRRWVRPHHLSAQKPGFPPLSL